MPMPSWWKKPKSKEETFQRVETPHGKLQPNKKKISGIEKPHKSFDDRITLAGSRDLASGSSSGFSGFESDSNEKRGIPLPRPSDSDLGLGGLGSIGSVSGSLSSVSSSGSTGEDHPGGTDLPNSQLGGYRVHSELKINPGLRSSVPGSRSPGPRSRSPGPGSRSPGPGSRSPGPGSRSPCPGSRSPAPGSRGASRPTSPLHPRLVGVGLDSPTARLEDGKSQCHPLPLPPTSPSSSSQPSTRCNGVAENTPVALSTWKKGKLLGRGTFGHVYVGFNSVSGQMCAIKEVRLVSDDQTSKECLKQLNQEINLLSQLTHPNIVRYYGSELSEETLSVYLEYVSGGSIHKLLQDYGPFKEPVIQNYTRQILSGLAYLHGRNTVHRDIKGANILVDPNGEIKLADFGMAKHITNFSSMLSFKGSPYWMAPEVVMNTNGYSLPVDIWSLGCTILEMATSKPPWSQYEGVAAIFKIGNSKDMPDIPDHLSSSAKNFIKLCLQRDPLLRPTAVQLLDHSFIRDQSTSRSFGFGMTADASPYAFDGSRSPPPLELSSNRPSSSRGDVDIVMKPAVKNAKALRGPRGDVRTITSLPVSPSSSPLRHYGPAHRSCFLSPPHPTYASMGQKGYDFSDYPLYPLRPSTTYPLDPLNDALFLQGQTPRSSPRMRPNLNM